jgi:23S rRNA pseudouridine2605 synthase
MRRRRPAEVSLERALSKLGILSRARAREAILAGRVMLDGRPAIDPGRPVVPERADLRLDGRPVGRAPWRTVLLHKPRGVVTTLDDPEGRASVRDLLPDELGHLGPVGRLDRATSGLLLLTNDTALAEWLCNPANGVERTYLVTVRGEVGESEAATACAGLEIDGERLRARSVTVRKRSGRESHLVVVLDEGKNREIRRLFAALGHEVVRLKRVGFGSLTLGRLAPGAFRDLGLAEVQTAFPGARVGGSAPEPLRVATRTRVCR